MTDKEFTRGIKQRDEKIFSEFVNSYQVPLMKLTNGFLHNLEESKELVQDVFVEIYQSIENFREESKLSTWVYRITVNKALNQVQRNKKRKQLTSLNLFSENKRSEIIDNQKLPGSSLEFSERSRLIKKAIGSLSVNQRIAFILNKYHNLSYKEIAEIMNITVTSVESLLHRAKINLQKKLFKLYENDML